MVHGKLWNHFQGMENFAEAANALEEWVSERNFYYINFGVKERWYSSEEYEWLYPKI